MATGWLAWTCLLLAAGAPAAEDVVYINQRGFQIPIRVQPERQSEVRELILYLSRDQGRTWEIYARATPDRKAFDFFASGDGLLYFSVAVTDRTGRQDPPDIYKAPVGQKIFVDTTKPVVRLVSAERVGEEVQVSWEVRDERPEWTSLKLEYRVGGAPSGAWTPLPVVPGERGNQRFRPGLPGDVTIRLTLRDQAGNEATDERTVPGSTGLMTTSAVAPVAPSLPASNPGAILPPPAPPPVGAPISVSAVPPPQAPAPPPNIEPTPTPIPLAHSGSPATGGMAPTRGPLPPLQIVNKKQIKLGFDVAKFGPSGLGSVDVYVTTDEGASWEKSAGEVSVSLPVSAEIKGPAPVRGMVTVQLPREGLAYGFFLVVKSRAGLGRPAPQSGDVPQVRVEVDTTQPSAELYTPQPDPARRDSLVLAWKAEDRNLAANPVSLEWSANPNGPWDFIGEPQLPNTGRYTWVVPDRTPPKVYLKLTVRDTAGNAAVAQTPEPQLIDLSVPEVGGVIVVNTR